MKTKIQDIADKAISEIKAIRDADLVHEDFKPVIGDWLEFSDCNFRSPILAKYGGRSIHKSHTYKTESGVIYFDARRPINQTDIVIKVDNDVMPKWVIGKDVTLFYKDGSVLSGKFTVDAWAIFIIESFAESFLVHPEKVK